MQTRRYLATAAGAGALIVSGLAIALAGPASAAPPTPTASPTRATQPAPSSAVPSPARTQAPVISVPAGNAGGTSRGGATDFELATLFAAGVVLTGAGTVVAVRRRA